LCKGNKVGRGYHKCTECNTHQEEKKAATNGKIKGVIKNKKTKTKIVDLEVDSNFEGGSPIKWQDHEIETLIAIQGELEEEFTKSTKKQGMSFCKKT
jgi:hypothetical protein